MNSATIFVNLHWTILATTMECSPTMYVEGTTWWCIPQGLIMRTFNICKDKGTAVSQFYDYKNYCWQFSLTCQTLQIVILQTTQCYYNTVLLQHCTTITRYYYNTVLLQHGTTTTLYYYNTVLLQHCTTTTRYYYNTVLLQHCTTTTRYYYNTVLL